MDRRKARRIEETGWGAAALGALALAAGLTAGCVSLGTYRNLEEKYEHVVDAKLDLDREYAEARRELLAVQEQHAKLAGEIAGLEKTVEGKIQAAIGPVATEVAKLQAERTAAVRERAREEAAREDHRRAIAERLDRLSADLDRLADRVTRAEVTAARVARTAAEAAKPKSKPAAAPAEHAPNRPAPETALNGPSVVSPASGSADPAAPAAKSAPEPTRPERVDPASAATIPPSPLGGPARPRAESAPLAGVPR